MSFAVFEREHGTLEQSREVYEKADRWFKENPDLKEERVMLLESWREAEMKTKDQDWIEKVNKKMPKRVKK